MNKPHKHAELIKAWADGAEIESRYCNKFGWTAWSLDKKPNWIEDDEYRIKPEPKPDIYWTYEVSSKGYIFPSIAHGNLKLTFDGETGELKSAEVLK